MPDAWFMKGLRHSRQRRENKEQYLQSPEHCQWIAEQKKLYRDLYAGISEVINDLLSATGYRVKRRRDKDGDGIILIIYDPTSVMKVELHKAWVKKFSLFRWHLWYQAVAAVHLTRRRPSIYLYRGNSLLCPWLNEPVCYSIPDYEINAWGIKPALERVRMKLQKLALNHEALLE